MRWQDLAADVLAQVELLLAPFKPCATALVNAAIAADGRTLGLCVVPQRCCGNAHLPAKARLALPLLDLKTDIPREDGIVPPHPAIDRALSRVAAQLMDWSRDPDSFELVQHIRARITVQWHGRKAAEVDPLAYGLWDE